MRNRTFAEVPAIQYLPGQGLMSDRLGPFVSGVRVPSPGSSFWHVRFVVLL